MTVSDPSFECSNFELILGCRQNIIVVVVVMQMDVAMGQDNDVSFNIFIPWQEKEVNRAEMLVIM